MVEASQEEAEASQYFFDGWMAVCLYHLLLLELATSSY